MAKKIILIVFGAVGLLIGLTLTFGGAVLVAVTGGDGFFDTGQVTLSTPTHALVSDPQTLRNDNAFSNESGPEIRYRVRVNSTEPIFIGIGAAQDVDTYLQGVQVDQVVSIDFRPFRLQTNRQDGSRSPASPDQQTFWVARASGTGERTVTWDGRPGEYRFVVMAADGGEGVLTEASFGIRVPFLRGLGIGLLIGGVVACLGGLALLIWGIRTKRQPAMAGYPDPYGQYYPPGSYTAAGYPPAHTGYPPGPAGYPPGSTGYPPGPAGYPQPGAYPGQYPPDPYAQYPPPQYPPPPGQSPPPQYPPDQHPPDQYPAPQYPPAEHPPPARQGGEPPPGQPTPPPLPAAAPPQPPDSGQDADPTAEHRDGSSERPV
ncbi:MAG: hypothetical protein V7637_6222 [Mycobacteriales bacterium]|jgi:hypothetical protein